MREQVGRLVDLWKPTRFFKARFRTSGMKYGILRLSAKAARTHVLSSQTHARTHAHTRTHSHTHTNTHTHTHTRAHAHTRTHTHTHTHSHTHTRTHTHTHTLARPKGSLTENVRNVRSQLPCINCGAPYIVSYTRERSAKTKLRGPPRKASEANAPDPPSRAPLDD